MNNGNSVGSTTLLRTLHVSCLTFSPCRMMYEVQRARDARLALVLHWFCSEVLADETFHVCSEQCCLLSTVASVELRVCTLLLLTFIYLYLALLLLSDTRCKLLSFSHTGHRRWLTPVLDHRPTNKRVSENQRDRPRDRIIGTKRRKTISHY